MGDRYIAQGDALASPPPLFFHVALERKKRQLGSGANRSLKPCTGGIQPRFCRLVHFQPNSGCSLIVLIYTSLFFFVVSFRLVFETKRFQQRKWTISPKQKSKQDIDKPKVQSLEDILKELDEEDEDEDEQEAERRMEELLAGELASVCNTIACEVNRRCWFATLISHVYSGVAF